MCATLCYLCTTFQIIDIIRPVILNGKNLETYAITWFQPFPLFSRLIIDPLSSGVVPSRFRW